MSTSCADDYLPVTCPSCDKLMWLKDFYTHHVHRVHGLHVQRCPYCMGKRSYNAIHALSCKERFLQKNRFIDGDLQEEVEELVTKNRRKLLKSEIAYLECKKEKLDLMEAYEELQKECEKLKTILSEVKHAVFSQQLSLDEVE